MPHAYRIIKWDERHENAESRKIKRALDWIRVPTTHSSMGLRRLLDAKGGLEAFGAYILLAEIAGTTPVRGVLADEHGPLSTRDMAIRTGAPERLLVKAIASLMDPRIGWIDKVPYSKPPAPIDSGGDGIPQPTPAPIDSGGDGIPQPTPAPIDSGGSPAGGEQDIRARARAKNQSPPKPPQGAAAGGVGSLLRRIGVPEARLSALPPVTAAEVLAHWHEIAADSTVKSPALVLAARLAASSAAPKLTPKAVLQAVKAGIVTRIGPHAVTVPPLGWNSGGLYLGRECIVAADQLAAVEVA